MGADALSNRITALQAKLNIEQTDEGRIALVGFFELDQILSPDREKILDVSSKKDDKSIFRCMLRRNFYLFAYSCFSISSKDKFELTCFKRYTRKKWIVSTKNINIISVPKFWYLRYPLDLYPITFTCHCKSQHHLYYFYYYSK
jgi:hypothetical protein